MVAALNAVFRDGDEEDPWDAFKKVVEWSPAGAALDLHPGMHLADKALSGTRGGGLLTPRKTVGKKREPLRPITEQIPLIGPAATTLNAAARAMDERSFFPSRATKTGVGRSKAADLLKNAKSSLLGERKGRLFDE
jgi:hypothetical protein